MEICEWVDQVLMWPSQISSILHLDDEHSHLVEGALSQALPKFVQMGFIVPDVAKSLEEEQKEKEQTLKMGKK